MNETFWTRFENLCKKTRVKPSNVAVETDIPVGSITAWKKGTEPNTKALKRIANYFNVSIDYLLGREDQIPSDLPADEAELLQDYRKASEEDKNMIRTLAKGAAQKQIPAEETA